MWGAEKMCEECVIKNMASRETVRQRTPGITRKKSSLIGLAAVSANIGFGLTMCVAFLGLFTSVGSASAVLGTLVTTTACIHFLAYTSSVIGVMGMLVPQNYDRLPGSSMFTKLSLVGVVMFGVFASATLLPTVPPINKPMGVGVNVAYYAISTVVVLAAMVFTHTWLTDDSELEQMSR